MTTLRALLFNAFFLGWTALLTCLYLLLLPFPWRVLSSAVAWWARSVLWVLKVLVGLRFVVRGREHVPEGAAIVAAKHQSAWDTIAINVLLDHPAVVLKRELLQLPVWGWLARRCGMIAVDRAAGSAALRRMLAAAEGRAAQGRQIVIFPQGTRTAPGTRRAYFPGVAALYDRLGLPVVPVALNSGVFWGRRAFLKKPGTIVVEFLPPIPPGLPRRQFLGELESRIETASDRLAAEAGFVASGVPQSI
ncbi:MAG: 1-acyl-sn-glycerol-3-phosphate acyltransferase [Alphaproteobacteria bacterium]|nr:1-acyl-sn-glycerol-3-phosphate acyltransferase [Alphaproteobacteria bacterium]